MSRLVGIYKTYENGEKELIARVASPYEAIKIAAEHHDDAKCVGILIRSESEEADAGD